MSRPCPQQKITALVAVWKANTALSSVTLRQTSTHNGQSLKITAKHSDSQLIIEASRLRPLVHRLHDDRYAHGTIYFTYFVHEEHDVNDSNERHDRRQKKILCPTTWKENFSQAHNASNFHSIFFNPHITMATTARRRRPCLSRLFSTFFSLLLSHTYYYTRALSVAGFLKTHSVNSMTKLQVQKNKIQ